LVIALDNFRQAQFRQAGGDAVLVRFADRLWSVVRPTDTVARLGGDEFLILCPAVTGPAGVIAIADRIATVDPHPGDGAPAPLLVVTGLSGTPPLLLFGSSALSWWMVCTIPIPAERAAERSPTTRRRDRHGVAMELEEARAAGRDTEQEPA